MSIKKRNDLEIVKVDGEELARGLADGAAKLERRAILGYILSCADKFSSPEKRDVLNNVAALIAQGEHTTAFRRGALDHQMGRVDNLSQRARA